jgi:2-(1,2-epoxy-1,2-dihydrophenyl)acetyl-CoA isomerase
MILFGKRLDAATALAWGLVAEVVEDPNARAGAIAGRFASVPQGFGRAKRLVRDTWTMPTQLAEQLERLAVLPP